MVPREKQMKIGLPLIDTIYGFRIITNIYLQDRRLKKQCRSKKRRIIKKWRKNLKNYIFIPSQYIYRGPGNTLIMHPLMKEKVIRAMETR